MPHLACFTGKVSFGLFKLTLSSSASELTGRRCIVQAAREAFSPLQIRLRTYHVVRQRTQGAVQGFPRAAEFEALDTYFA